MAFWTGVGALIVGIVLFGYGSLAIPSLFEKMRDLYANLVEIVANTGMGLSPFQILEQQLFLMQLLQLAGLGLAVLGAVMLVYGFGVKKQNKDARTGLLDERLRGRG